MSVIPIHTSNFEEGCGFFIGHYFLTSGHVIANSENPHILVNQNRINLVNPIFFEDNKLDPRGYDLAIFDVKEVYGTLELFIGEVEPGEIFKSLSYKELGIKYVECDIEVNDYKEGHYFGVYSNINLKEGCSGSPILSGNKVVGMMTAGNNDGTDNPMIADLPLNFCIFLSSKYINDVL